MNYLKLYEGFQEVSFGDWIIKQYNKNKWDTIKEVYCGNKKLTNLHGIEKLVNLEKLYCDNNNLINLEGMIPFENLKYINVSINKLISLEFGDFSMDAMELGIDETDLRKLKKLKTLECYGDRFSPKYKKHIMNYCDRKNILLWISE